MNNKKNDQLPIELENRVENVIQRIDGLEKKLDEMIEKLSYYVRQLSKQKSN